MYRFERLLNDARQLRIRRALRAQEGLGMESADYWLAEWKAGKILVLQLAGVGGDDDQTENPEVADGRRRGVDAIVDLSLLLEFIDRGTEALLKVAKDLNIEDVLVNDSSRRILEKFAAPSELVSADLQEASSDGVADASGSEEQSRKAHAHRAEYWQGFVKTRTPSLRDAAGLAVEAALFDIAKAFRHENDLARSVVARDEISSAKALEIVDGRIRRRRKPRRRKPQGAGIEGGASTSQVGD